ncbi:MAG: hypothetical protein ONB46_19240 [candidate division KSB1 bacterium]|nr:hypothetical protein [candidate division KSB1 bacterium]MDZ7368010.1 hypothetical protein [candidate division KSB1 bacterium]MDZ7405633.1 hypothetical protein [candidate division KSB1 bacterium]
MLNEALSFPPDTLVRIKIEGIQHEENGRNRRRIALQPQSKPAKMANIATLQKDDFIPKKALSMQEIEDIVRRMVRDHFETEEFVERIIWFKSIDGEAEIHLLEVNRDTPPSGAVMMLYFGATEKIPLPARVADVTPEEWEKISRGEIPLPKGWSLKDAVEFEREQCLANQG